MECGGARDVQSGVEIGFSGPDNEVPIPGRESSSILPGEWKIEKA